LHITFHQIKQLFRAANYTNDELTATSAWRWYMTDHTCVLPEFCKSWQKQSLGLP